MLCSGYDDVVNERVFRTAIILVLLGYIGVPDSSKQLSIDRWVVCPRYEFFVCMFCDYPRNLSTWKDKLVKAKYVYTYM